MGLTLTLAGLVGLTLFLLLVWPPLALLPFSVGAIAGGLLVDWGSLRGKPSTPPQRPS